MTDLMRGKKLPSGTSPDTSLQKQASLAAKMYLKKTAGFMPLPGWPAQNRYKNSNPLGGNLCRAQMVKMP